MDKYWYHVGTSAEEYSDGWVYLTEKEAEVISYVCNDRNWQNANLTYYSGSMWIDLASKRKMI